MKRAELLDKLKGESAREASKVMEGLAGCANLSRSRHHSKGQIPRRLCRKKDSTTQPLRACADLVTGSEIQK